MFRFAEIGDTQMKHLLYYCSLSFAVAMATATSVDAGRPSDDIEAVPFGSFMAYLQPLRIDYDPFNSTNQPNFDFEWFEPGYGQGDLAYNDGTVLSWQAGQLPAAYDTINYFDNNGITVNTVLETPESGERYTSYYRVPFNIASGGGAGPWAMEMIADDGASVYIDGQNVARLNCCLDAGVEIDPATPPWFTTSTLATGSEAGLTSFLLDGLNLSNGDHMLAISLHQANLTSSDAGLDFRIFKPGNGRPWAVDASGDWADEANWAFGVADSTNEWAVFSDAFGAPHTIWTNESVSVDGIQFENTATYNIAGAGQISVSDGGINSLLGNHSIQVDFRLSSNVDAEIVDGASLDFNNQFDLNGRTLTKMGGGDIIVGNTANTGSGTILLNEGGLAGSGVVAGDVEVAGGTLAPSGRVVAAGGAMTLTINGDANVSSGGIELTLYGNGDGDAISGGGSGTLNLGSAPLNVVLDPAYVPANGDSFEVFPGWSSINGTVTPPQGWEFDSTAGTLTFGSGPQVPCDLDGDADCDVADIDALTNQAGVSAAEIDTWLSDAGAQNGFAGPLLKGDSNLDGKIDALDLNAVGQNWQADGTMWSTGDFNGDDKTDASDLNVLGQNWQAAVPIAAQTAAVPEPSSLTLVLLSLLGLIRRKR